MSAQDRKITQLQNHIADLEVMRREYSALLNYLVWTSEDKSFTVEGAKLREMYADQHQQLRIVKSEPDMMGNMVMTFGDKPPTEPSRIIQLNGE